MEKKTEIITDKNEKTRVSISKILFKGKRQIPWDDVKNYLEQYDILDIKKKRATLSNPKILLGKKPIS